MVLGFILNSCASHEAYLSERMSMSERALCIHYYTFLVSGRNHPATLEAIEKRKIDCEPYKEEGILAGNARNKRYDGLQEILKTEPKKKLSCTTVYNTTTCREY